MNIPARREVDHAPKGLSKYVRTALLAGATLTGATILDGVWGKRHWPSTQNKLLGLEAPVDHSELTLTCVGLGATNGHEQATHAQKYLPGTAAYLDYSTDGFSLPKLAEIFRSTAPNAQLVHINGHSMGGPVGLEIQRHAATPARRLGKLVLLCSPFDRDDARLNGPAKILKAVRWPVGPGNKFTLSLLRNVLEQRDMLKAWQQAKTDALSGSSPRLWLSQARVLESLQLRGHQEAYKRLVGPETEMLYCHPLDHSLDTVVRTEQSVEKYAEFCNAIGVPFKAVAVPDVGHAQWLETFDYLISRCED